MIYTCPFKSLYNVLQNYLSKANCIMFTYMKKLILNSFKNMLKYRHYLMCSMSPVSESGDKESEIHSVESRKLDQTP